MVLDLDFAAALRIHLPLVKAQMSIPSPLLIMSTSLMPDRGQRQGQDYRDYRISLSMEVGGHERLTMLRMKLSQMRHSSNLDSSS